ncbi:hypothetical protein [Phaeodactylibacter xiamenensis]|uniref:hypothetical protein n=1 Tax=Phaeodactylibacter xiamenensis TaxID=1524460 RepID=UPI003BA96D33
MKKILLFAALLLTGVSLTKAQSDFRPGMVWMEEGDTLYGRIDYRGDLSLGQACHFKGSADATEQVFSPLDIKGYRFEDDRLFVAEQLEEKKAFLECLVNGAMEVYYHRDEADSNQYYFRKTGDTLVHLPYVEEIRYFDRNQIEGAPEIRADYLFRSKKHIGLLKYHLQDAPELQGQISKIEKPSHQSLVRLAKRYHQLKAEPGQPLTIYQKALPFFKPLIGVGGGLMQFSNTPTVADQGHLAYGADLFLVMPRVHERVFFRLGVQQANRQLADENETDTFTTYNVEVGYMLPETFRIRPYASINLLKPAYSAGAWAQIAGPFYAGLHGNATFYFGSFRWFPTDLFYYSLSASVGYQF